MIKQQITRESKRDFDGHAVDFSRVFAGEGGRQIPTPTPSARWVPITGNHTQSTYGKLHVVSCDGEVWGWVSGWGWVVVFKKWGERRTFSDSQARASVLLSPLAPPLLFGRGRLLVVCGVGELSASCAWVARVCACYAARLLWVVSDGDLPGRAEWADSGDDGLGLVGALGECFGEFHEHRGPGFFMGEPISFEIDLVGSLTFSFFECPARMSSGISCELEVLSGSGCKSSVEFTGVYPSRCAVGRRGSYAVAEWSVKDDHGNDSWGQPGSEWAPVVPRGQAGLLEEAVREEEAAGPETQEGLAQMNDEVYDAIEHHSRIIEREAQRLREMATTQPVGIDAARVSQAVALDIMEHAIQMTRKVK